MSRAFTSEQDGWFYCPLKKDDCMFAGANGTCMLSQCKWSQKSAETAPDRTKARSDGSSYSQREKP